MLESDGSLAPNSTRRDGMAQTYEKQLQLQEHLCVKPLGQALQPLRDETGVDFHSLFVQNYNVGYPDGAKEPVKEKLDPKDKDVADLLPYFDPSVSGRRFYRYLDQRHHPEHAKNPHDFVVVEENLPQGGILLAIFDYPVDPYTRNFRIASNRSETPFLKLRGCFALQVPGSNRVMADAVDLTGFWTKPTMTPLAERLKMSDTADRKITIGLAKRDTKFSLADSLNNIKAEHLLLLHDETHDAFWANAILCTAMTSQDEGDIRIKEEGESAQKSDDRTRFIGKLGRVRYLLDELSGNVENNMAQSERVANAKKLERDPNPEATQIARNWIRNRMAVSLEIFRWFHNNNIPLLSSQEYKQLTEGVNNSLLTTQKKRQEFVQSGNPLIPKR